jgi:hypothetical protein
MSLCSLPAENKGKPMFTPEFSQVQVFIPEMWIYRGVKVRSKSLIGLSRQVSRVCHGISAETTKVFLTDSPISICLGVAKNEEEVPYLTFIAEWERDDSPKTFHGVGKIVLGS